MLHCDEETLGLLALGEPGPVDVEAHIAECPQCAGELAALRTVVTVARSPEPQPVTHHLPEHEALLDDLFGEHAHPVHRIAPPAAVWSAIAAATGVEAHAHPAEVARHAGSAEPVLERVPPPASRPTSPPAGSSVPGPAAPEPSTPEPSPSRLVPSPRKPSWRSRWDGRMLAVAASCLVVGLLGGVIATQVLSDDAANAPVVAATALAGLPAAPTASGQADVVSTGHGDRTLDLDVRKLGTADGFYEVWLIDPTVTKMVPVGVLSGGQGRFVLPAGVDLADYPVVDVSIEPLDGNPAHSGKSVLRGTLRS